MNITPEMREQLGPLANLVGEWEGSKGIDIAPDDDRGIENNKFRELIRFEPAGLVQNHEQFLYVLRYSTRAWKIGEENPFHEELGYWTWEPATQEIMRCFVVPRGITVIAGGKGGPDVREFKLRAEAGSSTFGVVSSPFLNREFKTLEYNLTITLHADHSFSYDEDTVMQMPGRKDLFHHRDRNTLKRVGTELVPS